MENPSLWRKHCAPHGTPNSSRPPIYPPLLLAPVTAATLLQTTLCIPHRVVRYEQCVWVFPPSLPPIARTIRRGLTMASVKGFKSFGDVTRLSYMIESGGIGPWGGSQKAMMHEAGQFVFLNVSYKKVSCHTLLCVLKTLFSGKGFVYGFKIKIIPPTIIGWQVTVYCR